MPRIADPDLPGRILDAAEEVFAETGYAAASTREMARRARVPFGAVHYHWGSKRQLWEAVFARLSDRTRDTLLRTVRVGATRGATIDGVVDAFFDYLVASPNVLRLAYRAQLAVWFVTRPRLHGAAVAVWHGERLLVLVHALHAELLEILDGGGEADGLRDGRRAGLKPPRQVVPGRAIDPDLFDHLAATPRGLEGLEHSAATVQHTEAGRAEHLVR